MRTILMTVATVAATGGVLFVAPTAAQAAPREASKAAWSTSAPARDPHWVTRCGGWKRSGSLYWRGCSKHLVSSRTWAFYAQVKNTSRSARTIYVQRQVHARGTSWYTVATTRLRIPARTTATSPTAWTDQGPLWGRVRIKVGSSWKAWAYVSPA